MVDSKASGRRIRILSVDDHPMRAPAGVEAASRPQRGADGI